MTTFTSEDRQEAYQKKVEEAPYHPGYEDAVVPPKPAYKGMDPAKMLWKPKPLTEDAINEIYCEVFCLDEGPKPSALTYEFVKTIEERHGIK